MIHSYFRLVTLSQKKQTKTHSVVTVGLVFHSTVNTPQIIEETIFRANHLTAASKQNLTAI